MPLGFDMPGFGSPNKPKKIEKEKPPLPAGAFDNSDQSDYMAPAMRFFIAEKWKTYTEEEKLKIVSQRARRGIRCHICGSVGYYRENCPNSCLSPPPTPDSMASTPPGTLIMGYVQRYGYISVL